MCIPCLKARIEYIKLAFLRALCWDTHALEAVQGLFSIVTGIYLLYPGRFNITNNIDTIILNYPTSNVFWGFTYILVGCLTIFVTIFLSAFIRRLMSLVLLFLWLSATSFFYYFYGSQLVHYMSFYTYMLLSIVSIFTHLAPWRYKWR